MSIFKFKSLVLFINIITKLLLLRPFIFSVALLIVLSGSEVCQRIHGQIHCVKDRQNYHTLADIIIMNLVLPSKFEKSSENLKYFSLFMEISPFSLELQQGSLIILSPIIKATNEGDYICMNY